MKECDQMVPDTIITFVKDPDGLSLAEIESARQHKDLHVEDTKLNLQQGVLLGTDFSNIKLTVKPDSLEYYLNGLGYSEKDIHKLPSENKADVVLSLFRGLEQVLTKNFNKPIKGIVFHVDEDLPHGHIFFAQKKKPQGNNIPVATSPIKDSSTRAHHHQQEKNQLKETENSKSMSQRQQQQTKQEHLRFIQRQNVAQQTDIIEDEKKKLLQYKKQQEQRCRQQKMQKQHERPLMHHQIMNQKAKATAKDDKEKKKQINHQYQPYWQKRPSQDGPEPS